MGNETTEEKTGVVHVDSAGLLGVRHELENFRHGIRTVWKKGLLIECEQEFDACRNELTNFNKHEWRIVRIERHLVTPNV